tara:strand:- start:344 stop:766 length:423 start_codon:yes stop_codon:yes gene_type:complete
MDPIWLYVLTFVFGYYTHKAFYFFRSMRLSIGLIKVSQLVSLAVLARSMENFYYSHTTRLRHMRDVGSSEGDLKDARRSFNVELTTYKEKVIGEIIALHPRFYHSVVPFDNWRSAMKHLEENKEFVLQMLDSEKNDKKDS